MTCITAGYDTNYVYNIYDVTPEQYNDINEIYVSITELYHNLDTITKFTKLSIIKITNYNDEIMKLCGGLAMLPMLSVITEVNKRYKYQIVNINYLGHEDKLVVINLSKLNTSVLNQYRDITMLYQRYDDNNYVIFNKCGRIYVLNTWYTTINTPGALTNLSYALKRLYLRKYNRPPKVPYKCILVLKVKQKNSA